MNRDMIPRIFSRHGTRYAAGYCGSGVVWARWAGQKAALQILGDGQGQSALDFRAPPAVPLFNGKAWFLPMVLLVTDPTGIGLAVRAETTCGAATWVSVSFGADTMTDATYPTTCWECSTCCGALATVRDGRVVDFAPNRDNPYSKGAFCIKGIRGAPGITYGANRLLYPMRRTGTRGEGKWARVSWDEALDEMADRLAQVRQKHGPEAIVGTSGASSA